MNARLLLAAAFMIGGVVSAWAGSTIDPTKPVSGLPYTSAPIRNNFQALINDINALQQLTLTVANNAALHALNSTGFVTVTRLGFYAPDDGPRIIYTPTNAACTLNSGVGDDGSQVALANGKCAVAAFGNTDLVPEIWGCVGDGITA